MSTREDIQIADIEKELDLLWAANKGIRAHLFNLIVCVHDLSRLDYIREIIQKVLDRFPCRLMFITKDTSLKNQISVSVSNDQFGQSSTKLVCDQIILNISPEQFYRVPFIIMPHLVPDLPVYLFWDQDPTIDKEAFPAISSISRRVIFDSSSAPNISEFASRMQNLMRANPRLEFLDLNWLLISGWRHVFMQVFDLATNLEQLKAAQKMEIFFNDITCEWLKVRDIQALYLTCWLGSSLNWQLQDLTADNGGILQWKNAINKDLTIEFIPEKRLEIRPGNVMRVDIYTENECTFFIAPHQDFSRVVVHVSTATTCDLPYTLPLPSLKPSFAYAQDLFFSHPHTHYANMLNLLSKIQV